MLVNDKFHTRSNEIGEQNDQAQNVFPKPWLCVTNLKFGAHHDQTYLP